MSEFTELLRFESRRLLRRRSVFWSLVAGVSAAALVPAHFWPDSETTRTPGWTQVLINSFFQIQLAVLLLAGPFLLVTSIAEERELNTWESLLATPFSPAAVVTVKAAACFGYMLLYLVATAPAFVTLELLGGVARGASVAAYVVTLLTAVTAAGIAMAVSARDDRPLHAILKGAGWGVLAAVLPLALQGMALLLVAMNRLFPRRATEGKGQRSEKLGSRRPKVKRQPDGKARWKARGRFCIEVAAGALFLPLFQLAIGLTGTSAEIAGQSSSSFLYALAFDTPVAASAPGFCLFLGIFTAAVLLLVSRSVARSTLASPLLQENQERSSSARVRRERRADLAGFWIGWGERGIRPWRNPIFMRDAKTLAFGGAAHVAWTFLAGITLGLIASLETLSSIRNDVAIQVAYMPALVFALVAPYWAVTALLNEIERSRADLWRSTRLTTAEVLGGKLLVALSSSSGAVTGAVMATTAVFLSTAAPNPSSIFGLVLGWGLV